MISEPIAFVLGAGVSMPYGFPSGKVLLEQIYYATRPPSSSIFRRAKASYEAGRPYDIDGGNPELQEISSLLNDEFGENAVKEFGDELYKSQQVSIDAFLEHRQEFMKIGKTCIAMCIARKESDSRLLDFETRGKGCYQYIFQKMNTDWETFSKNKIAFITFNYDRSLEEYMFTGLKSSYGKTDEECAVLINQIPIVHVHGSLGPLPWQSVVGIPYDDKYISPNGDKKQFSSICKEQMRNNIIVMSEGQDKSPEFQRAINLLIKTRRIYFLGFGYHTTNLQRLKIDEISRGKYESPLYLERYLMQGSAMGMESAEMNLVINKWHIALRDNKCDALLFLQKYVRFA